MRFWPGGRARDHNRRLGQEGERRAEALLVARGCRVLARNLRQRRGELDLVVLDGAVLVFCEVKTRTDGATGGPADAIDGRKQQRLEQLAEGFLAAHPEHGGRECRFDAVLVEEHRGEWRLEWVADAFRPGW
ncbi:MAG: YraN family protein [Magnetococcus sp. WYHC-3]